MRHIHSRLSFYPCNTVSIDYRTPLLTAACVYGIVTAFILFSCCLSEATTVRVGIYNNPPKVAMDNNIDVMGYANKGIPLNDVECVRCSACVVNCPMQVLTFGSVDKIDTDIIRCREKYFPLTSGWQGGLPEKDITFLHAKEKDAERQFFFGSKNDSLPPIFIVICHVTQRAFLNTRKRSR